MSQREARTGSREAGGITVSDLVLGDAPGPGPGMAWACTGHSTLRGEHDHVLADLSVVGKAASL